MTQPPCNDKTSLSEEIKALSEALKAQKKDTPPGEDVEMKSAYRQGMRIGSEFVSAILVGVFLGLGIDWLFGIGPFGLILFSVLSFCAAFVNIARSARETQEDCPSPTKRPSSSAKNDAF